MVHLFPVLVAECTQPSLGVGYEIARSEAMMKKILILFQAESESGEWIQGSFFF